MSTDRDDQPVPTIPEPPDGPGRGVPEPPSSPVPAAAAPDLDVRALVHGTNATCREPPK